MKGQTLLEVLIAMAAGVVVLSAISVAVLSGLNSAQYSRSQNTATSYAQQGMEVVKSLRNQDWGKFKTYSGPYCMKNDNKLYPTTASPECDKPHLDNFFIREITFNVDAPCNGSGQTKVTVTVGWTDGKCSVLDIFCNKVTISSCFSDYGILPTL